MTLFVYKRKYAKRPALLLSKTFKPSRFAYILARPPTSVNSGRCKQSVRALLKQFLTLLNLREPDPQRAVIRPGEALQQAPPKTGGFGNIQVKLSRIRWLEQSGTLRARG